ncbi:tRNA uridine-5-carboxymethylaminomethyl(34) synthesis GTPase MnmE [bacterium]|nr:tRNA uridine-5-carboxymethylaminomethyl(34) synthesis GTPase MnmE [bacterium]
MTKSTTIFALSSGQGRAGVAIIRVSGAAAREAVVALTGKPPGLPRMLRRCAIKSADGTIIDDAMAVWFAAPKSFTGEDVAEFHVHGGRAVIVAALAAVNAVPGCVPADAGAFTRRAFDNEKLDLTQVEGLADLINAETEGQRKQAVRQFEGVLGTLYESWRVRLVRALAHLEADIDFPDEDLPDDLPDAVRDDLVTLAEEMTAHINDGGIGERTRDGFHAVIVGAPNVGKSSIINRLAGRSAAIVASSAGTTRDVVEVRLDVAGLPVTLADTAGLHESGDDVEREGIRRSHARSANADLKIAVFDATTWPLRDDATARLVDDTTIIVVNKIDCMPSLNDTGAALLVSALDGTGIDTLVDALRRRVIASTESFVSAPPLTRLRHRRAVDESRSALGRARTAGETELCAEDLRLAARALGRITGRVDAEDLLDVIFKDFCIGK